MKKFLVAVMFGLMAIAAQAEATFEQIEGLIQQQNYSAAAAGLEVIIQNHPKSAKAFYAMAQAQAGMGNLEKAQKALNIATGLNPTLDFAPASSVASLKQAITPQVAKIEAVETSHALRNFMLFAMFAGFGVACYFLYSVYQRKQEEEEATRKKALDELEAERAKQRAEFKRMAEESRQAEMQAAATPQPKKTKKQLKEEADALALREATARAEAAEADARRARMNYSSTPAPTTTVVHNSNDGLLTGVLIGNMMSNNHHDTTVIREREVVRESAPSRSSTWNDTPAPSKSSSWDDDSSSKSSSSWSSSSDSSSSSSWDSGSSSSDSSSSSSWD